MKAIRFSLVLTRNWRRKRQPTPVFLPGEFQGQRSLVRYGPWGHKESDRTEQTSNNEHILSTVRY